MIKRILIGLAGFLLSGCVDRALLEVPDHAPARLVNNSSVKAQDCQGRDRSTVERYQIGLVSTSGIPAHEANYWARHLQDTEPFPILNHAHSLRCEMSKSLPFAQSIGSQKEIVSLWVYGPPDLTSLVNWSETLLDTEQRFAASSRRLGVNKIRIIVALVCDRATGGDSFAFVGRANTDPMTVRAVAALPCEAQGTRANDAAKAAIRQAMHESFHVAVGGGGREVRFWNLANELMARAFEAEWAAEPDILGTVRAEPSGTSRLCTLPMSQGSLDFSVGDHSTQKGHEDSDGVLHYADAIAEAGAVLGITGERDGFVVVIPEKVAPFLDRWGRDATGLARHISEIAGCP
jgi:hypothetical protein